MIAIDNSNLLTLGQSCDCTTFVPTITAVWSTSATTPNIIITESSTIPSGDNFKAVVVTVTDGYGNKKYARVANTGSGATFGTVTFTGSGPVLTAPVSGGGTGYCGGGNGQLQVTFTGGGGSGATGYAVVTGGIIQSVVITNGGTGYTTAPTAAVVIKSAVITTSGLNTALGINIHATVLTWGGTVNTAVDGCRADVYSYGLTAAGTYTIGDDASERDFDVTNDTE